MVEGNHIYLTIKYLDQGLGSEVHQKKVNKNGKIGGWTWYLGKGRKTPYVKLRCCRLGTPITRIYLC